MNTYITDAELIQSAPSVFHIEKGEKTSSKFQLFNTYNIIEEMRKEGFEVTYASENKNRMKDGSRKHLIRFSHRDFLNLTDGNRPEVILLNAHNGTSSYNFIAGMYRFCCENGLIVANEEYGKIRIRHMGHSIDEVIEASLKIASLSNQNLEEIKELDSIILNDHQKNEFALESAKIKYGYDLDSINRIQHHTNLLNPKRNEDVEKSSLWNVFNTVQENLIKGGELVTQRRMREIKRVDENARINQALWSLTQRTKQLVLA